MSSIPLITHRMLAAAAATERRLEEPFRGASSYWQDDAAVSLELLEEPEWAIPAAVDQTTLRSAAAKTEH